MVGVDLGGIGNGGECDQNTLYEILQKLIKKLKVVDYLWHCLLSLSVRVCGASEPHTPSFSNSA